MKKNLPFFNALTISLFFFFFSFSEIVLQQAVNCSGNYVVDFETFCFEIPNKGLKYFYQYLIAFYAELKICIAQVQIKNHKIKLPSCVAPPMAERFCVRKWQTGSARFNAGRPCRPSRSGFFVVFSETRSNTGQNPLERPPLKVLPRMPKFHTSITGLNPTT